MLSTGRLTFLIRCIYV